MRPLVSSWLLLLGATALLSALPPARAQRCTIIVARGADPLELYAASELRKYLRALYGLDPALANAPGAESDNYFLIGNPQSNPQTAATKGATWPKLSDQGITFQKARLQGKPTFLIGGGSPRATLWAVYEFLQRTGVRFLLEKDVLPARPEPFPPTQADFVQEPQLRFRSYRGVNDLATSLVFYGMKDYRHLIDQLAKMKFNVFYAQTYPFQPFVDYAFKGQNKTTGELHYGWKLPIHAETIGRELFAVNKN